MSRHWQVMLAAPCARPGCPAAGDGRRRPFCPRDWRKVPRHLQRAVAAAYTAHGAGSPELAAAVLAAAKAIPQGAPHA